MKHYSMKLFQQLRRYHHRAPLVGAPSGWLTSSTNDKVATTAAPFGACCENHGYFEISF